MQYTVWFYLCSRYFFPKLSISIPTKKTSLCERALKMGIIFKISMVICVIISWDLPNVSGDDRGWFYYQS